ncbi:CheW protein [Paraglaciecola sp. T6c]|uniref:chemotaxis protein CheW n=1 Tax=Pseudoalteromonas atlantica (strain T6c / ATCC BAA-1087) TaxID=3042615 RepID=UPI00005C60CF|nr:chemotaxis protein CheW [Paraglaciecola sp. T6c]ABG41530.1 CheW protein [Paraglaciecola sp. T6c]
MNAKPPGKKSVMEEYLSSLLIEDVEQDGPLTEEIEQNASLQHVSQLLDSASVLHTELTSSVSSEVVLEPAKIDSDNVLAKRIDEQPASDEVFEHSLKDAELPSHEQHESVTVNTVDNDGAVNKQSQNADNPVAKDTGIYHEAFQVLIFEVAGLSLALPLTELGGIHQLADVTPIFGKPNWFKGVMLHRDEKMKVVDTAMWVMPEKCNEKLADSAKNQYLIMLDSSGWGLACERIIDTITLQAEDVKWRKFDGKRTWLSGMVKKKMCALVNVKQLISLLQQGMNSKDN